MLKEHKLDKSKYKLQFDIDKQWEKIVKKDHSIAICVPKSWLGLSQLMYLSVAKYLSLLLVFDKQLMFYFIHIASFFILIIFV